MEVNCQDILKMFAYHSLCDSLKSDSRKIKTNQINDGEREKGGGAKIPLKRSVLNANHRAYRRLSGPTGFGRPAEFGLYRPRLLPARPALAWPVGNTELSTRTIGLGLGDAYGATLGRINGQGEEKARLGHFDVDISC